MDSVDFFQNIDLKEVSKKTLIDKKDLNYIKNEEFDKLSKTKGLGFIKIIEREYKIDLSDKKDKFIEYLKEHGKESAKEFFIAPPKQPIKILPKLIVILLVLLIAAGIVYIVYLNTAYRSSSNQANIEKNQIVKEAQAISGIDINESNDTNKEVAVSMAKQEDNGSDNSFLSNKQENSEKNISVSADKTIKTAVNSFDTNSTQNEAVSKESSGKDLTVIQKTKPKEDKKLQNDNNTTVKNYNLTIIPKNRIWVGVVDLENYKKKSYLKDTNITINKNHNFMIATGHGEFKLLFDDRILDFNTKNPVRFVVKDGNISQISRKEFIKLNRGKYW